MSAVAPAFARSNARPKKFVFLSSAILYSRSLAFNDIPEAVVSFNLGNPPTGIAFASLKTQARSNLLTKQLDKHAALSNPTFR